MTSDKSGSDILKIDDAARYLGVTRRWIYRRIWSGDLPASKVGGLYFLRKNDLEALIDQGRSGETSRSDESPDQTLFKCGYCFRLLDSDTLIGDVCKAEGCDELICVQCLADENRHCVEHVPDRDALWQEALRAHKAGEFPVLVKAEMARLREVNFTERLQARLTQVNTLRHPLSEALVTVQNWDEILVTRDNRAEVMKMMNKVVLDVESLARIPLNASFAYRIAANAKNKTPAMAICAQVYSHLKPMLQQGFDTTPFGSETLVGLLTSLGEQAKSEQVFHLVMLAATTGWDEAARQMIRGDVAGTAFSHRWMIVYLYDMESHEIIYNRMDARARAYVELFSGLHPDEEDQEISIAIEKEMGFHESLTLAQAVEALPYSSSKIERAFEKMAASGRYVLTNVPELGQAIVRE